MSNDKLFRALSSPTRIKILKVLTSKEMHLTGLAKEINISVPVTSRHIKILEEVNLINKRIFGKTYLLTARIKNLEQVLEPFVEKSSVEINKQKSVFDALKQIPAIRIKKIDNHYYIKSIDGDEGYYIYEVNGKLPEKPIDEFNLNKNVTLELKKLVTVNKKKINIKIKKK